LRLPFCLRDRSRCARLSFLSARRGLRQQYRQAVFAGRHLVRLEQIMRDVCADYETNIEQQNRPG
jgi:hypothetical protein